MSHLAATFLAAQGLFIVSLFFYMIATIACGSYLMVTRFQRDQRVAITVNALLYLAGKKFILTHNIIESVRQFLKFLEPNLKFNIPFDFRRRGRKGCHGKKMMVDGQEKIQNVCSEISNKNMET